MRRTICQQALYFRTKNIKFVLPGPLGRPSLRPCSFLKRRASFVLCEIKSLSISAAMEKVRAKMLDFQKMTGSMHFHLYNDR
ncbi:MAG: hypothetical protein A2X70_05950 [Alphaproteobacteria bacterium GWC2_42_16]|nr:MAG: hypothetical protein A2X70_05950 [Alphaproteobacteria bacterium GWC2_42_16]OFW84775.1 MAG: hypothetical protein A3E50_00710 [Alphaproteobacteria bacterium RIFCSPHIGHO2_12_FULL_42_100]OFW84923.1 MAG: hypothetical protein A2W06_04070 [Alphaproteobacteria bacterium RBG_16_42_14]OFW90649.1 MAG: hypothetical protein A3C41_04515 [Alphaproteobacteria bacterium RIFCSPHIGHO2_02_FULL_42_30]